MSCPLTDLDPTDASTDGRTIIVTMPDDLTAAVRATARAENASEFMVLLAAFQVLVHRMTGAVDIPVGVPIANRHWLESESLITSLVNTLVIRTDLAGATNFSDVVQRVRDVTLDAFEHQELPFERLVQELAPPRDLSRSPLFQLFFNVQNAPFEMPAIDGLHFEVLQPERRAAQFDLSLTVDTAITNTLTLEYATALFDDERMHRFLDDYLAIVREGVIGRPVVRPARRSGVVDSWCRRACRGAEPAPRPSPVEPEASILGRGSSSNWLRSGKTRSVSRASSVTTTSSNSADIRSWRSGSWPRCTT